MYKVFKDSYDSTYTSVMVDTEVVRNNTENDNSRSHVTDSNSRSISSIQHNEFISLCHLPLLRPNHRLVSSSLLCLLVAATTALLLIDTTGGKNEWDKAEQVLIDATRSFNLSYTYIFRKFIYTFYLNFNSDGQAQLV